MTHLERLLDPKATIGIVLGASYWQKAKISDAPSFRRSASYWANYLAAAPPFGLGMRPDFIINLFDNQMPASQQLIQISGDLESLIKEQSKAGTSTRDVLVYYVGHGTCIDGKNLHLLVRDTMQNSEEATSISAKFLSTILRNAAPKQRRVVVLDCCFSEGAIDAFGTMGAGDEAWGARTARELVGEVPSPERGTILFASSPRTDVSFGPADASRTLFTGALLDVLGKGIQSKSDMISFTDLHKFTFEQMRINHDDVPPRPALHQPDQHAGPLLELPAFPNAYKEFKKIEDKKLAEARAKAKKEARAQGTSEALANAELRLQEAEDRALKTEQAAESSAKSSAQHLERAQAAERRLAEAGKELELAHQRIGRATVDLQNAQDRTRKAEQAAELSSKSSAQHLERAQAAERRLAEAGDAASGAKAKRNATMLELESANQQIGRAAVDLQDAERRCEGAKENSSVLERKLQESCVLTADLESLLGEISARAAEAEKVAGRHLDRAKTLESGIAFLTVKNSQLERRARRFPVAATLLGILLAWIGLAIATVVVIGPDKVLGLVGYIR